MEEETHEVSTSVFGRKTWFLLGLLAGMLIFPWAAGLPYKQSWAKIGPRIREGPSIAWHKSEPLLVGAWNRLKGLLPSRKTERHSGADRLTPQGESK